MPNPRLIPAMHPGKNLLLLVRFVTAIDPPKRAILYIYHRKSTHFFRLYHQIGLHKKIENYIF